MVLTKRNWLARSATKLFTRDDKLLAGGVGPITGGECRDNYCCDYDTNPHGRPRRNEAIYYRGIQSSKQARKPVTKHLRKRISKTPLRDEIHLLESVQHCAARWQARGWEARI